MEMTVSARHTEVPERLRAAVIEKVGRLDRFLEGMDRAEVHFTEEKNPRITDKELCEVTLEGHGHHVRAKVAAPDGYVAIDRAVDKLEHQLQKLKSKLVKRHRANRARGAGAGPAELPSLIELDGDEEGEEVPASANGRGEPRIVKAKRFTIKPMSPEEAVGQMDLLNHDFYFFTNADTSRAAVVYRRDDGDVGLIDEADG